MDEPKPIAGEGMQALADLFSNGVKPCKSSGRTYVLELKDGCLAFRRHEFCLMFDEALNATFGPKPENSGDEIVPQKLAGLFPGRSRSDTTR
jgi:hypothetical protein